MSAKILSGIKIASAIKKDLKTEISNLKKRFNLTPKLVAINIEDTAAKKIYLQAQNRLAKEIGIDFKELSFPKNTNAEVIKEKIIQLNKNRQIDGIIIMQPVPCALDYEELICSISPLKDVEGLHPLNLGKILLSKPEIVPATARAIIEILDSVVCDYTGKEVVMVGHSAIVGKPVALLLADRLATVRFCHIGTSKANRLIKHVKEAEILIVAVGKPHLIKGEWIKKGSIIIDAGINRLDGKILGDVEYEKAKEKASYITPVPGGVGPVTTIILMSNLIRALKARRNIQTVK